MRTFIESHGIKMTSPTFNILDMALFRKIKGEDIAYRVSDLIELGYKTYGEVGQMSDEVFLALSKKIKRIRLQDGIK